MENAEIISILNKTQIKKLYWLNIKKDYLLFIIKNNKVVYFSQTNSIIDCFNPDFKIITKEIYSFIACLVNSGKAISIGDNKNG